KQANELVRKAKENVEKGNIQEAANLYSDAAEIYQNAYKQTNNEVAKKTIQQLFIKANKEAKRISRQIMEKQNKDNLIQQQKKYNRYKNSNTLITNNNIYNNSNTSIGNINSKFNNTSAQSPNIINTPNTPKNLQNFRFTNTTNTLTSNNNNNNTIENNIKSKPNYNNHEPATIPITSLNSSTIDESTSSHFIDQSYFVLKENKRDEAEKAFIKFWDDIDDLVQNKVSLPVALLSAPLNREDAMTNKVKKEKTSTLSKVSITSPSVNKNNSIGNIGNKNNEEKSGSNINNTDNQNDFEIIDDDNLSESEYLVIPQKTLPKKTIEEYQEENEKLKQSIDRITNDFILLPNTEEFKLALRKAKEYVKYNEYIRSNVATGSENELSELKKRVAYLEENNYVKQIMKLEEENKDLKMKIEKLTQENIKYKNQWNRFVSIAEAKKKKNQVLHSDINNKNSQGV
ncbi:hypothetical protein U3516DRAFT_504081, partial [Neocallimastix sp. 'constans']